MQSIKWPANIFWSGSKQTNFFDLIPKKLSMKKLLYRHRELTVLSNMIGWKLNTETLFIPILDCGMCTWNSITNFIFILIFNIKHALEMY